MRIVYVEDILPNFVLVDRIASAGGHVVTQYTEAETALENLEKDDPEIMLIDIRLPGEMHGLELTQQLRARGFTRPIVIITATLTDGMRQKCFEAGCDDFLPKPLAVHRLFRLLEHYQETLSTASASSPAAGAGADTAADTDADAAAGSRPAEAGCSGCDC
jgi:CheY-like chemotaxis protein